MNGTVERMPWLAPMAVLHHGLLSTLPAGATMVRTGERAQQVLILAEGTVDEIVGGVVIQHTEPGTLLGVASLGQVSAATLRARTRVTVVAVLAADMERVGDHPEVARWLGDQRATHDHQLGSGRDCGR